MYLYKIFIYLCTRKIKMVDVAQQVRVADCGSAGRGFESHHPPAKKTLWKYFMSKKELQKRDAGNEQGR